MKSIFAITIGTIVLLLMLTLQGSLSVQILLAFAGLAFYAVALSPGITQIGPNAWRQLKPSKPKLHKPVD
jgi:hypothetical protein